MAIYSNDRDPNDVDWEKTEKKLSPEEMIQDIMEHFNFIKVEITMNKLDWKWVKTDGEYEIPSIDELKINAEQLLRKVVAIVQEAPYGGIKGPFSVATGGFKATAWKSKKGNITDLELEFILTAWDSYRSIKHL